MLAREFAFADGARRLTALEGEPIRSNTAGLYEPRVDGSSMLILTRRPGESIRIGHDITISVLDVQGKQVRLGINAPKNISVDREEVAIRKRSVSPAP